MCFGTEYGNHRLKLVVIGKCRTPQHSRVLKQTAFLPSVITRKELG
jgi:hypothetical protein